MNIRTFAFVLTSVLAVGDAYVLPQSQHAFGVRSNARNTALKVSNDDKAMECYFVYNDDDDDVDATPEVICTTEPEEYAWFNGIDEKNMKPTNGAIVEGAVECVEGASPRGIPEWECQATSEVLKEQPEEQAWQ